MIDEEQGYIVLRRPEHFLLAGKKRLSIRASHGEEIQYCGVERDPWLDAIRLCSSSNFRKESVTRILDQVKSTRREGFSLGVCRNIKDAELLLELSNSPDQICEIIFVNFSRQGELKSHSDSGPSQARIEFLGFDSFIDGYGSLLAMGPFLKPEAFTETLTLLNKNGLFETSLAAEMIFPPIYVTKERALNLEPVAAVSNSTRGVEIYSVKTSGRPGRA